MYRTAWLLKNTHSYCLLHTLTYHEQKKAFYFNLLFVLGHTGIIETNEHE